MVWLLIALLWVTALGVIALGFVLYYGWKVPVGIALDWLIDWELLYDQVPEPYATAYERRSSLFSSRGGGKFFALACSQKGYGAVKALGNLDWAIRKPGDTDDWPAYTNDQGRNYPAGQHTYTAEDFYWDRRSWLAKKVFGEETAVVWMGLFVKPKYYHLRINNFRTVKPTDEEIKAKNASVREYVVNGQRAGYLISWNEWTKRVLLADDSYPFPIDGIRIGVISSGAKKGKQQAVSANILTFVQGRIREPYLYLYRNEETLETIQNQLIQIVRQLCSTLTIDEALSLIVTLQAEKADQENPILKKNNFGEYIRTRYGFTAKSASFGPVEILGKAGEALEAPFVARQEAEAEATRGEGEGKAEANRLRLEGEAFQKVIEKIGVENAVMLRTSDVAGQFATGGKASTVVLGFDPKTILGGVFGGRAINQPKPKGEDKNDQPDQ